MQANQNGCRGLSLVMGLNWDRILYVGALAVMLTLGAYLGSL